MATPSNTQGEHPLPVLYTYFRSSCSWRVRAALNLKGIQYESRFVNLMKGEQFLDDYTAIHAHKEVPALVIRGQVITQSVAILEYLDEVFPDVSLLPANADDRAKVRSIVQGISADIQPVANLRVLNYVGPDKKAEWSKYWITLGFQAVEAQLAKTAGLYCFGNNITQADVVLVPQVYNARRWGVDMSAFPTIVRVDDALSKLEAFKKADWKAQDDCPEDLR